MIILPISSLLSIPGSHRQIMDRSQPFRVSKARAEKQKPSNFVLKAEARSVEASPGRDAVTGCGSWGGQTRAMVPEVSQDDSTDH